MRYRRRSYGRRRVARVGRVVRRRRAAPLRRRIGFRL